MSDYGTIDLSGTLVTASGVAACRPRALTVYGRSTQAGTPTPSAPVAIVSVAGNLLDVARSGSRTDSGVTWTYNADGTVTVTGTATDNPWSHTSALEPAVTLPAGTYTASVSAPFGIVVQANGSSLYAGTNNAYAFTLSAESNVRVYARAVRGTTYTGETTGIMLTRGSTVYPYVPYGNVGLWARRTSDASTSTVTPIDLDGHELRSLPDGTRDEVTVDARGHAVLVQRVGAATLVGIGSQGSEFDTTNGFTLYAAATGMGLVGIDPAKAIKGNLRCDKLLPVTGNRQATNVMMVYASGTMIVNIAGSYASVTEARAALTAMGATVTYPLATPQTIDLGTVDPVPLVGPDLTAQAVPTAPFALTALLKTGRSTVMWDGEELGAGWTFVSDRREQLLPTDVATIDVPGRDGALFGGVTRAVRQVTLALYVLGPVGERAPHVRELAARLAVDGPRPLMFSDEAPLWRMAVPNADPEGVAFYNADGYADVKFVCPDPWFYGEEGGVTVPSGGSVTFTVGGTAPTMPIVTAPAALNGSGGVWQLMLDDTTYIAASVPSARSLVCDCVDRVLRVNGAVTLLRPDADWLVLEPGTHTLAMTGTGAATVTWTERWY